MSSSSSTIPLLARGAPSPGPPAGPLQPFPASFLAQRARRRLIVLLIVQCWSSIAATEPGGRSHDRRSAVPRPDLRRHRADAVDVDRAAQAAHRAFSSGEIARREGARLVAGGEPASVPGYPNGLFYRPTIFADVRNDMRIAQE
ncbi:MAG: aldehyde dehydrogenase family protein, partial [Alphaproteobacteria bacterium]|nr:aldehyde dehydrogenase family protein [Alphaproteobacteria bacterium]